MLCYLSHLVSSLASTTGIPQGLGMTFETTQLEKLWRTARVGSLTPLDTLRAWAVREAYREVGIPEKKICANVASKVQLGHIAWTAYSGFTCLPRACASMIFAHRRHARGDRQGG